MTSYIMCTAQPDNLGDVVLRRRMLQPFLRRGRCVVFVGSADDALVASLLIPPGHVVTRSFANFFKAALFDVRDRDWVLGYDAGELTGNPKSVAWQAVLAPLAVAGLLLRRPRYRLGVGLRSTEGAWTALLRPFVRLASVNRWREPTAPAFFRTGELAADWGFDEALEPGPDTDPAPRDLAVVSMRGDRAEPSAVWVEAVRDLAARHDLVLQVVPQVQSDNARSVQLAASLGAELVAWTDAEDHVARERTVRERYRRATFVVSDRLHALVMGFTEGAMPLGIMSHADVKVGRHFAAVGVEDISLDIADLPAADVVAWGESVLQRADRLPRWQAEAAERVRAMDRLVTG